MSNLERISIRSLLLTSLLAASVLFGWEKIKSNPIPSFAPLNRYTLGETVAEIIAASPDGNNLAFTSTDGQKIGFIDITNPQQPIEQGTMDVSHLGEPTAVAITPNGQYALATVEDLTEIIAVQQPGTIGNLQSPDPEGNISSSPGDRPVCSSIPNRKSKIPPQ